MSAEDETPAPENGSLSPAAAALMEELTAGSDVAAALGPWVARLHEPTRTLLSNRIAARLEDDGFHIVIPWYDGGTGDRLRVSIVQDGREADCGVLEGVRIGGCMVTKPRSVCITEHGMTPLRDIAIRIDGNDAGLYRGKRLVALNGSMTRTADMGEAAFAVMSSHDSVWVRSGGGAEIARRLPGTVVVALNGRPVSDVKSFDLSRRWPRTRRVPGRVSYLPAPSERDRQWRSMLWDADPSGRAEQARRAAFRSSLPGSCTEEHTPRFGFVGRRVSIALTSDGPILHVPGLEYISGEEPVLAIIQDGRSVELPRAGSVGCGGYRVRIRQDIPTAELGFNPLMEYALMSGDTLLHRHPRQKAVAFDRDGRPVFVPAGECFILSDPSVGWRAPGALYLETTSMWGMDVSRAYLPERESRDSIRRIFPSYIEIDPGDGIDDAPVEPIVAEPPTAPTIAHPHRPKRLRTGQVLEDGAVVCSPDAPKDIGGLGIEDLGGETDEHMRGRILRTVLEHTGDWASDPHPPARRFVGPAPSMRARDLHFYIGMSCYEGGPDDRLLVEVSQGDACRVLTPSPASIDAGGCRITDDYTISLDHLGLDPFAETVLRIDGREVFRFPASDILLFDTGGCRTGRSDDECTVCHRSDRILMIDGAPVAPGIVQNGIAFTSVQGRFSEARLVVPEPPEEDEVERPAADPGDDEEAPRPDPAPAVADEGPAPDVDGGQKTAAPPEEDRSMLELLDAASLLFERRHTTGDRPISELSLEDVFGDGMSIAGYGTGRGFVDSSPSLYLAGTAVYLFLPAYAGCLGDALDLRLVPSGGRPVDLGPMRTNEDGSTRKMLLDTAGHGIGPLDPYEVRIDGVPVYRNPALDFLLFDREGRRLMSTEGCSTVVLRSGTILEGAGFSFEESCLPDGTAFVTIEETAEDGWFRIRRPRRAEEMDPRVRVLPDRGFLGRTPWLDVRGGSVRLNIPPYRCRDEDPRMICLSSDGTRATEPLDGHPDRRGTSTYPASFDLERYGISILDGLTASIDGREVFSSGPCDSVVLGPSGPVDEPSGDVWMVYREGLVPYGDRCEVLADVRRGPDPMIRVRVRPGGTLATVSGNGRAYGSPLIEQEPETAGSDAPVQVCVEESAPEAVPEPVEEAEPPEEEPSWSPSGNPEGMLDLIRSVYDGFPLEEPEPTASPDYSTGYGFFDGPPRLLALDGRMVLAVPPYSGSPGDQMEAVLTWNGGETRLGRLPRESRYSSALTFVDLLQAGTDIPGGFSLRIDGDAVFTYPPSSCSVFSASGVRTDLLDGDVTVVLGPRAVLQGASFSVGGVSGIQGGALVRASIGDGAFVRIRETERPLEVPADHAVVWSDRCFVGRGPEVRLSGTGPVLRIPGYRCVPGDPCAVSIKGPGGSVSLGELDVRPGLGAAVTVDADIDLPSRGIDVLDGFSVSIDGREVLASERCDRLLFDAAGSPSRSPHGRASMLCREGQVPCGKRYRVSERRKLGRGLLVVADVEPGGYLSSRSTDETQKDPADDAPQYQDECRGIPWNGPEPGFDGGKEPFLQYRDDALSVYLPRYRSRAWAGMECRFVQSGAGSPPFVLESRRDGYDRASVPGAVPLPPSVDPLLGFDICIDDRTVHTEPARRIVFFPACGGRAKEGGTGGLVAVHHVDEEIASYRAEVLWTRDEGRIRIVGVHIGIGAYYGPSRRKEPAEEEPSDIAEAPAPEQTASVAANAPADPSPVPEPVPEEPEPEPAALMPAPDPETAERVMRIYRTHPPEDCEPHPAPDPESGYGFFDWPPRLLVLDGRLVLAIPPYSGRPEDPFYAVLRWTDGESELGRMPRESEYGTSFALVDMASVGADAPGGFSLEIDGRTVYGYPASDLSVFSDDGTRTDVLEGDVRVLLGPWTVLQGSPLDVISAEDVPGGALVRVRIPEGAAVRTGRARRPLPDAASHVRVWSDRSFVDRGPSIRNSDDGLVLRMPRYRCVPGDQCEVTAEASGEVYPLGRLTARPGLGAAVTDEADIGIRQLGAAVLDGFSVSVDGREVFSSGRRDRLLFTYSGMPSDDPKGEATMVFRPGQIPSGKDFEILEERDLGDLKEVVAKVGVHGHLTSADVPAPQEEGLEEETDEGTGPDDKAETALLPEEPYAQCPPSVPEPVAVGPVLLAPQTGFVEGEPRLMYIKNGIALRIPSYRARVSAPLECWIEQSGIRTEPTGLASELRADCRVSAPTTLMLPPGIDPLAAFGLFIDGAVVHAEPDRDIAFFPAGGGIIRNSARGSVVAVHRRDADIVSYRTEPQWTRDVGDVRYVGLEISPGQYYGPDRRARRSAEGILARDLLRTDGTLESEHRARAEERARRRAEEEAERTRKLPRVELEAGVFRDGGPAVVYDGHGFVLHVPSFTAEPDRGLSLVVFVDGAPAFTGRLGGPIYNGIRISEPVSYPLEDLGASPFDRIEVLLDGAAVFSKEASDALVMDRRYRYTGVLEGTVVVAMRKGVLFERRLVTERSRRIENGMLFVTFDCAEGASLTAVPQDGKEHGRTGFRRGRFPSVALRDGRFVLRVPSYLGRRDDPYDAELVLPDRTVPVRPLVRSRSSDATVPAVIDLTAMDVSPLEEFVLRIDGEPVFANRATDRMIFGPDGDQVASVVGSGFVAVPKGTRTRSLGVGIVSTRDVGRTVVLQVDSSKGGVVETGRIHEREYLGAVRAEPDAEDGADAAAAEISFADRPLDIDVRRLDDSGNELPGIIPAFARCPSVEVSVTGCRLSDCTVRAESSDGHTVFGPVQATSGRIQLDTAMYHGFARAVVSCRGHGLASADYLVDGGFRVRLPESAFLHTGDMTANLVSRGYKVSFPIRDGNYLDYNFVKAIVRFNVVLYSVRTVIAGEPVDGFLQHRDVSSSDLGPEITVNAVLSGGDTPTIRKRILISADGGRVVPLTRSWIEGETTASTEGFLKEMEADHLDRHIYIEEEGRGVFEFLTVRWKTPEEGQADAEQPVTGGQQSTRRPQQRFYIAPASPAP